MNCSAIRPRIIGPALAYWNTSPDSLKSGHEHRGPVVYWRAPGSPEVCVNSICTVTRFIRDTNTAGVRSGPRQLSRRSARSVIHQVPWGLTQCES